MKPYERVTDRHREAVRTLDSFSKDNYGNLGDHCEPKNERGLRSAGGYAGRRDAPGLRETFVPADLAGKPKQFCDSAKKLILGGRSA